MILRILADAEYEINAARQYLNGQSPGLGGRFLDELASALQNILDNPLRFSKVETLPDGQPYRRARLSSFRYAVVFEVLSDLILVVAVAHSSRLPNYWLGRTD